MKCWASATGTCSGGRGRVIRDRGSSARKEDVMSKAGGVNENPVTGEHVHPAIDEDFTVVRGRVGFRIDGRESVAEPGERLHVPAGTAHDWWNAGQEEALVRAEIRPGARF